MTATVNEQATETVRGACPHDCPDTCAMLVSVRDGRAVEVRGDPEHPFTRGGLCVKVNNYVDKAYSPDRVLYPMRRTGPKGSGQFTRVSWDEALDRAAAGFSVQRREELPDRISLARGAGLLARQLHGAGEIRKPRHGDTTLPYPPGAPAGCRPLSPGDPCTRSAGPAKRASVVPGGNCARARCWRRQRVPGQTRNVRLAAQTGGAAWPVVRPSPTRPLRRLTRCSRRPGVTGSAG